MHSLFIYCIHEISSTLVLSYKKMKENIDMNNTKVAYKQKNEVSAGAIRAIEKISTINFV